MNGLALGINLTHPWRKVDSALVQNALGKEGWHAAKADSVHSGTG